MHFCAGEQNEPAGEPAWDEIFSLPFGAELAQACPLAVVPSTSARQLFFFFFKLILPQRPGTPEGLECWLSSWHRGPKRNHEQGDSLGWQFWVTMQMVGLGTCLSGVTLFLLFYRIS